MLIELKKAIWQTGLKQRFIAEQLGIDETHFSKLITGRRTFSDTDKRRIADLLGKSVAELFPGDKRCK